MRTDFQNRYARLCATAAMTLLVAACATTKSQQQQAVVTPAPPPPVYQPLPGLAPGERVEEAVSRLRTGQADKARAELKAAIAAEPENKAAQTLLASIDADPKAMLGETHYAYTVRAGETLWSLSKRLLGDPLMFYVLARYNQIDVPESVAGGQVLLIPGVEPKRVAAPARRPAAKGAPAVQAKVANPAQAVRLRRTALEHMSRGQIDKAEALLKQASVLDPGNATIQADLGRARRIQAGVRPGS